MNKLLLFLSILFAVSCNSVNNNSSLSEKNEQAQEEPQPPLKVYDTFDEMKEIFEFSNDSTYVINFWATWCKPCVAELPYFEKLYQENKDKKLKIYLVSLDMKKQLESRLIPFLEKNKLSPEVVLLADNKAQDWIDRVDESWSGSIPATVVYNREYVEFYEREFDSYDDLNNIVQELIN